MDKRLDSVDGVRAVAILWVALFHFAFFWSAAGKGLDLLPYDDMLAWIPLADVGHLGVSLFFIVSGLVIALSLTRSKSASQFGLRRMARLWPTFAVCATLTFLTTTVLGPEVLRRSVPEYLISLSFVPPAHVGRAFGVPGMEWLDGAYWSIWVEVRFYALAAFLYFALPWSFIRCWAVVAAGCAAVHLLGIAGVGPADALSRLLFAEHQPFFTAGIALAFLMHGQERWLARALLTVSVALALFYGWAKLDWATAGTAVPLGAVLACFVIAAVSVLRAGAIPLLRWAPMTALGRASYVYYLLHQNLGLALLAAVPLAGLASVMVMLAIQAGLIALAIFLHLNVEKPVLRWLRRRIDGPRVAAPQPPQPVRSAAAAGNPHP